MNCLPAIYHDIILEFLKNKKLAAIFLMYFVAVALLFVQITHAYFTDSATSTNNTFTAAATFPTPTPIPGIANHIVISEMQIASAAADDEFFEIYNPTSSQINLSALPLKLHIINGAGTDENRALTFINSTIPAHGFFLVGPSSGYTGSAPLDATYTSSGSKLVNNGAAYISTSITDGTDVIDLVGLGTASVGDREGAAVGNPADGGSVERKALSTSDATSMSGSDVGKGNGYDTDNNATDFILRPISQPQNSSSPTESP